MAEIHLQRKRKNLWWLWLLIILIVLAVVYYLYINNYFTQENVTVMHRSLSGLEAFEGTRQMS
ncbi:MAG: hypothetical protein WKF68_11285 [Daejeonella sp.]